MRIRTLEPESYSAEELLRSVARARGCSTAGEIGEFLDPDPPIVNGIDRLHDYPAALARIRRALSNEESVCLFGDYDCDGITSLVQAHDFFRAAGHPRTRWFIPDRMRHDYGLSQGALEECVASQKPALVIALDCGSAAHGPIAWLREQEIDCIVIDHHAVVGPALSAAAHLNPKADGAVAAKGPLAEMSAAGLSFLLFERLAQDLAVASWSRDRACLLAGLGTVVDVMPLRRLNRALVKQALRLANQPESLARVAGLVALREITRTTRIDVRTLGFRFGPRLNAGGRLEDATNPVELLLASDLAAARPLAQRCHETNIERRELQRQMEDSACLMAERRLTSNPPERVLLLCDADWHPGVVGIVASRLRERYGRPSIVCGWHADGYWRGSGRSPEGFDLGAAVQAARDAGLVLGGGGHPAAAGLTIAPEKVDELRRWLDHACPFTAEEFAPVHEVLAPADALGGTDARSLIRAWCELYARLEPFGAGHPAPNLILRRGELRWGPKGKTRRESGERWAVSAGFTWRGSGYLFADWLNLVRADQEWSGGGRYDLVLAPTQSEGMDRTTGIPTTYYDWRVVDCERVG